MNFKSEEQLRHFLLNKCRLAIMSAQDKIYVIIQNFLRQFYNDYDPVLYERTYQLLQSLVQTRIVSDGMGYKAEIYFDIDSLNYTDGAMPSGGQVMSAAAIGLHGAKGLLVRGGDKGIGVWEDPILELDAKGIDILKSMLIAEGVPVK